MVLLLVYLIFGLPVQASAQYGSTSAAQPSPGMMLVASPGMRDPRFSRTVILLIQHSARGSLGVIVNKPTDVGLVDAIPGLKATQVVNHVLYFGGPVQTEHISYAHTGTAEDNDLQVLDGVSWGSDVASLVPLLDLEPSSLRVYFGYAGWGPGQLEFELSLDDWQLVPARAVHIFSDDSDNLWRLLNKRTPKLLTEAFW